jgi:hypothetical protein
MAQIGGMRWERYIGGGILGERYTRRLSLGRYFVIAIVCKATYHYSVYDVCGSSVH